MNEYTVILLDDEELILESLRKIISWKKEGLRLIGTAGNGDDGKDLIDRLQPDIVMTDIRMDGMDGLELAGYLAKEHPRCRVIILSAYADFHYAQDAIAAGVDAYLLKPIKKEELLSAVRKAKGALDDSRRHAADTAQMMADMENVKTHARSSLLFNIARYGVHNGGLPVPGEEIKKKGVVVMAEFYNTPEPMTEILAKGRMLFESHFRDDPVSEKPLFGSADALLTFLCPLKGKDPEWERKALCAEFSHLVGEAGEIPGVITIGCSGIFCDASSLQHAYSECREMMDSGYFLELSGVITRVPSHETVADTGTGALISALTHGREQDAQKVLAAWRRGIVKTGNRELAVSQMREFQREITMLAARLGMETAAFWTRKLENENFAVRYERLSRVVSAVCDYARKKSNLTGRVLIYLDEHYQDHDLSLESVAGHMSVNSSYLSRTFKKERGQNFSGYLLELRIRHACRLLKQTSMKTAEIAERVGFEDAHYFGQVFKRNRGMSPTEYRERHASE